MDDFICTVASYCDDILYRYQDSTVYSVKNMPRAWGKSVRWGGILSSIGAIG